MALGTVAPSVFEADLPTLSYEATDIPADVYPRIRAAQRQAPVALGPFGPEILSYQLVRSVLRDPRCQIPPGLNLVVQGRAVPYLRKSAIDRIIVGWLRPVWGGVTSSDEEGV